MIPAFRSSWSVRHLLAACMSVPLLAACAGIGPPAIDQTRLQYNEALKRTAEEQLLLNIVRLRYTDTPSSLAVTGIAAQFEVAQSLGLLPFFTAAGGDLNRSFTAMLPQAQATRADRPTFSFTPLDDQEFTRKLFTPLPLEGLVYLAKTTWPISTVFRLYLENLNWVPNAQTASGPTPRQAPPINDFLEGVHALQRLQDRGDVVFGVEEQEELLGGPLPATAVTPRDVIEAARSGYVYRPDEDGRSWSLVRRFTRPTLQIAPSAVNAEATQRFLSAFRLKPGLLQYAVTQEALPPFREQQPRGGLTQIDLETRSLLQALYYVSLGVDVPPAHLERGVVTLTRDADGTPFDWQRVMIGLFRVRASAADARPADAHVAVRYRDHWFYVDDRDTDSKSTFSLLMELARLELAGKTGPGPQLTLPVGR